MKKYMERDTYTKQIYIMMIFVYLHNMIIFIYLQITITHRYRKKKQKKHINNENIHHSTSDVFQGLYKDTQ